MIHCEGPGKNIPGVNENESYSIDITSRQAFLSAPDRNWRASWISRRSLQLLDADRNGYFLAGSPDSGSATVSLARIADRRRASLPTMEVLKRNLDAMAAVKLNVFHWHLTEDQGFRVESKKFPKLHQLGSDGNYYTQDQVREIIAYARDRGIRVVPSLTYPVIARVGWSAIPNWGVLLVHTRLNGAREFLNRHSIPHVRRSTSFSKPSWARWRRFFLTIICTSAEMRTKANSGTATRRFRPT